MTGRDIAKQSEQCKLIAYVDPATGGLPITIGWGSTRNKDGKPFKLGDEISQEMADALFDRDFNIEMDKIKTDSGIGKLPEGCIEAIASLCYNIKGGFGAFKKSNCYVGIINKDVGAVFHNWDWGVSQKGVARGLAIRRARELAAFLQDWKV